MGSGYSSTFCVVSVPAVVLKVNAQNSTKNTNNSERSSKWSISF